MRKSRRPRHLLFSVEEQLRGKLGEAGLDALLANIETVEEPSAPPAQDRPKRRRPRRRRKAITA